MSSSGYSADEHTSPSTPVPLTSPEDQTSSDSQASALSCSFALELPSELAEHISTNVSHHLTLTLNAFLALKQEVSSLKLHQISNGAAVIAPEASSAPLSQAVTPSISPTAPSFTTSSPLSNSDILPIPSESALTPPIPNSISTVPPVPSEAAIVDPPIASHDSLSSLVVRFPFLSSSVHLLSSPILVAESLIISERITDLAQYLTDYAFALMNDEELSSLRLLFEHYSFLAVFDVKCFTSSSPIPSSSSSSQSSGQSSRLRILTGDLKIDSKLRAKFTFDSYPNVSLAKSLVSLILQSHCITSPNAQLTLLRVEDLSRLCTAACTLVDSPQLSSLTVSANNDLASGALYASQLESLISFCSHLKTLLNDELSRSKLKSSENAEVSAAMKAAAEITARLFSLRRFLFALKCLMDSATDNVVSSLVASLHVDSATLLRELCSKEMWDEASEVAESSAERRLVASTRLVYFLRSQRFVEARTTLTRVLKEQKEESVRSELLNDVLLELSQMLSKKIKMNNADKERDLLLLEVEFYLTTYAHVRPALEFAAKHSLWTLALKLALQHQVKRDVFVELIAEPCRAKDEFTALRTAIHGLDPGLQRFSGYLVALCAALNEASQWRALVAFQLFMKDYTRAGLTCVKLFTHAAKQQAPSLAPPSAQSNARLTALRSAVAYFEQALTAQSNDHDAVKYKARSLLQLEIEDCAARDPPSAYPGIAGEDDVTDESSQTSPVKSSSLPLNVDSYTLFGSKKEQSILVRWLLLDVARHSLAWRVAEHCRLDTCQMARHAAQYLAAVPLPDSLTTSITPHSSSLSSLSASASPSSLSITSTPSALRAAVTAEDEDLRDAKYERLTQVLTALQSRITAASDWERVLLRVLVSAAKCGDLVLAQQYISRLSAPLLRVDALIALGKHAAAYLEAVRVAEKDVSAAIAAVERVKEAAASRRDTAVERLCARFLEQRSSTSNGIVPSSLSSSSTLISHSPSPLALSSTPKK